MNVLSFFSRFCTRFAQNERGSVLILFGIGVIFLVAIGGAAIDLGRQQMMSVRLQNAADAAAVSAATLTNDGQTMTSAEQMGAARRYFTLNSLPLNSSQAQPLADITLANDIITITSIDNAATQTITSFVGNFGIPVLKSRGSSKVQANVAVSSDYDVVMVVDESGSERLGGAEPASGQMTSNPNSRMAQQQSALRTMTNSVLSISNPNPNVRMALIGFSGRITNRWGLTNSNFAMNASINLLRPVTQNFDHYGMMAAANMLNGANPGTSNTRIGGGFLDDTVDYNMAMPVPQTARTNTSDINGLSPKKYVIFMSDGGIMYEPNDLAGKYNYDKSGLVHAACPGRQAYPATACYQAFTNACNAVKNTGGTDNVHLIVIDFVEPLGTAPTNTMKACASKTLPGGATYSSLVKPDPNQDFFFAPDVATLNKILTNVTTQIQSVRIIQ